MESVYHFTKHLQDAIVINTNRKQLYAKMTHGKSRWLSSLLIFFEKLSSWFSPCLDKAAIPFQKRGIPIVAKDFVSMESIKNHRDSPPYQKIATDKTVAKLKRELSVFRNQMTQHLKQDNFQGVAKDSYDLLAKIKAVEAESESHFAMTCHLIESIGLAALNAVEYSKQSHGETNSLSKRLINFQKIALWSCLYVDKLAQKIHRMGIGIIVNDVPHIPFEEQYEISG